MGPGQSTDVRADRSDGQGPRHRAGLAPAGALPSGCPLGHVAPCAGVVLWAPRPLLHQTPQRTGADQPRWEREGGGHRQRAQAAGQGSGHRPRGRQAGPRPRGPEGRGAAEGTGAGLVSRGRWPSGGSVGDAGHWSGRAASEGGTQVAGKARLPDGEAVVSEVNGGRFRDRGA